MSVGPSPQQRAGVRLTYSFGIQSGSGRGPLVAIHIAPYRGTTHESATSRAAQFFTGGSCTR